MCNKSIDHTAELTQKLSAMPTHARDCCDFFKNPDGTGGAQICQRCAYGEFEVDTSEHGTCKFIVAAYGGIRAELDRAEHMLEAIVSNIKGGVITCIYDSSTQSSETVYINPGWTAITGYTKEELNREKGGNPQSLIFPEDSSEADMAYTQQTAVGNDYELMYRVVRKDGAIVWVIDRGVVSMLENKNIQNQSIVTEVTALKQQEEELRRLAQTDQLTSLYNRGTGTHLAQTMLKCRPKNVHAVFMLDIDDFKRINDDFGHVFGDRILQAVASTLKNLFRSSDIVARLGGDEFGMFTTDITPKAAECRAAEICQQIRSIKVGNSDHPEITVSLGVALSAEKASWENLYKKVDDALYKAKSLGKNQYYVNK